jgi:hypothetical protein
LGQRQAVMALMNWAIDVPQKLLQSDAKSSLENYSNIEIDFFKLIKLIKLIK